jgi:hypothetical protein
MQNLFMGLQKKFKVFFLNLGMQNLFTGMQFLFSDMQKIVTLTLKKLSTYLHSFLTFYFGCIYMCTPLEEKIIKRFEYIIIKKKSYP